MKDLLGKASDRRESKTIQKGLTEMDNASTDNKTMEALLEKKDSIIRKLQERNRILENRVVKDRVAAHKTLEAIIKFEEDLRNIRNSLITTLIHGENAAGLVNPGFLSKEQAARIEDDDSNDEKTVPKNLVPANMRTDAEKEIVRTIGEGLSVSREIKIAVKQKTGIAESTLWRHMTDLKAEGILECINNQTFPGTKGGALFKLTKQGEKLYRDLYGEAPVTPEMEKLRAVYGSYETGYGIRACGRFLQASGLFEAVVICPEKVKIVEMMFQPHIICKTKEGKLLYFEYHRCKLKSETNY